MVIVLPKANVAPVNHPSAHGSEYGPLQDAEDLSSTDMSESDVSSSTDTVSDLSASTVSVVAVDASTVLAAIAMTPTTTRSATPEPYVPTSPAPSVLSMTSHGDYPYPFDNRPPNVYYDDGPPHALLGWAKSGRSKKLYIVTCGTYIGVFDDWTIVAPLVIGVAMNCYKGYKRSGALVAWEHWAGAWRRGQLRGTLHGDSMIGAVFDGHNPDPAFRPASPLADDATLSDDEDHPGLRTYAVTTTTMTTTYYVPLDAPACPSTLPRPDDAPNRVRAGPTTFVSGSHHVDTV